MKRFGIGFLVLVLMFNFCLPLANVSAAENAVGISITSSGGTKVGETIKIRLSASKPSKALAGLEFTLSFNPKYVAPVVTENNEDGTGIDGLNTAIPQNWGNLSSLNSSENKYYFRFVMPEESTSYLDEADELIIEVPFKIIAAGSFSFNVSASDVIAIAADEAFTVMGGTGAKLSLVTEMADGDFEITFGDTLSPAENGYYYLSISVKNTKNDAGIIALQFDIKYDSLMFRPTITKNDSGQMDVFMDSMPQNAWEQMCTLYEDKGILTVRLAALHAESTTECEKLEKGSAMSLIIPFYVIGLEGSSSAFAVESESAVGVDNANVQIFGSGSAKNLTIGAAVTPIPAWRYSTENGYLMYVSEETSVSDFLATVKDLKITSNGKTVESGYVCTGYTLTDGKDLSYIIIVKGDVNGNGTVDARDYIFTKRAYFNTYKPSAAERYAMLVTGSDEFSSRDYIFLKRHYFGTYNINN